MEFLIKRSYNLGVDDISKVKYITEKKRGARTESWGTPVLKGWEEEGEAKRERV